MSGCCFIADLSVTRPDHALVMVKLAGITIAKSVDKTNGTRLIIRVLTTQQGHNMTAILINQLKFYPQQYRIYQGKNKIDLQPKCAELLNFLAERHGQVISKETLLQTIWQDRVVGEDVLTSCIRKIRKQLNDDAKSPQFIETINKKGYRLIATVATPKTKQWWGKLFTTSMAVIFLLGVMSFGFTHSEITIHRFSTTDTIEEREQKLRAMAGFIEQNPNETRSLTISIPSATTNNHSDES